MKSFFSFINKFSINRFIINKINYCVNKRGLPYGYGQALKLAYSFFKFASASKCSYFLSIALSFIILFHRGSLSKYYKYKAYICEDILITLLIKVSCIIFLINVIKSLKNIFMILLL